MVFVIAIYFARQSGAYGEAATLAQERARLAQLILRRMSAVGAPITVRERRGDSLPPIEIQRSVQLEPRVRELLNVVRGFIWVLSDTILYASADARQLDSASLGDVNTALNELRRTQASSRQVALGRQRTDRPPGHDGRTPRDAA